MISPTSIRVVASSCGKSEVLRSPPMLGRKLVDQGNQCAVVRGIVPIEQSKKCENQFCFVC